MNLDPNPGLMRPSLVLFLLSSLPLGFYREFSCPGYFTPSFLPSLPRPLPTPCLHSVPVNLSILQGRGPRLGVQGMKCQRAQSKDDTLSVTISLFHARDVQSLLGVEIGKPTSNASKETKEERETTYQSALDPKHTKPWLSRAAS